MMLRIKDYTAKVGSGLHLVVALKHIWMKVSLCSVVRM